MKSRENKIRIVYFVNSFSPISETFVYDQVKGISAWAEVLVLCHKREHSDIFPFQQVSLIPVDTNSFVERLKRKLFKTNIYLNFYNRNFSTQVKAILEQFQPQLIHCHFGIQALRLLDNLERFSIPIAITFHGYDASQYLKQYPVYKNRLRKLFKSKYIFPLSVSKAVQQSLIEHQLHSPNHQVLYNGIDIHFFKREKYSNPGGIFLQISRLTEKKGIAYTLQAFRLLVDRTPNFVGELVIAGEGDLQESLLKKTKALGLDQWVSFKGSIDRTAVKALMERAHVFVQHSVRATNGDTEGLPMTLMEAMAMDLPILSTYHAGIPELVEHGLNGYLAPEKDIDTYAQHMMDIRSWTYAKKNRAKIRDQFSLDVHLKQVMRFYEFMLRSIE